MDSTPESLRAIVARAIDALLPNCVPGQATRTPEALKTTIDTVAYDAYRAGQADAASDLYSADDVAAELSLTPARVRALATARRLGSHIGRGETWVFRRADIEAMRDRMPGRPSELELWRAGSLMALDWAIADRHLAPVELDTLNKRVRAARFGRTAQSDQDLLALLREFCPDDSHIASYPGPR